MSKKLVASAPTKEDLEDMINKHFYSEDHNWIITESGTVFNKVTKRTIEDWSVCVKKGRWRLERIGG